MRNGPARYLVNVSTFNDCLLAYHPVKPGEPGTFRGTPMLKVIHLIEPHLLHLLLLSGFFARIKTSAVLSPPIRSGTEAFAEDAPPSCPCDGFTCTFDAVTAPPPPSPTSHSKTSAFSILSSRENPTLSPPPEKEYHLILEENFSFLPAQAAAAGLEAFYKGVKTILAHYAGDDYMLRMLFGEMELIFMPLARMQAVITREMVSCWVDYMLATVARGEMAAYRGWMIYGPDVRVRVGLRVRGWVGVNGVGVGW